MICACTRFVQGKVLNDKKPETIVKALHRVWCLPYGFWSNNGREFRNSKMEEFVGQGAVFLDEGPWKEKRSSVQIFYRGSGCRQFLTGNHKEGKVSYEGCSPVCQGVLLLDGQPRR